MEKLLTISEFPVEGLTPKNNFSQGATGKQAALPIWTRLRRSLRLRRWPHCVQFNALPNFKFTRPPMTADVHRFEESIAGRLYLIEVKAVSKDRWSACIVRVPGVPTALMPFYGPTPDEAARQLSEWLTRAYARAANPTNTV